MTTYVWDNAWLEQRQRLAHIEAQMDPGTIRHLTALGVDAGWQCLEVGGGGGSIAQWLCQRVGATGEVLATDLDTRFLDALTEPNLTVQQHNIVSDALPTASFDLIHTRWVLVHLPDADRRMALQRMVRALRPGGWLLAEEFDAVSFVPDPAIGEENVRLLMKGWQAIVSRATASGADLYYARRLAGQLSAAGLVAVDGEGRVPLAVGGSPATQALQLTAQQVQDSLLSAGLLTEEEFDRYLRLLEDPQLRLLSSVTVAAWGQRPQE